MSKKVILHSGGQDSTCLILDCMAKGIKPADIISLGFDYGQRHFVQENAAAFRFCEKFGIERVVLTVPLGEITKGSPLTDTTVDLTTELTNAKTNVVQLRNMMFITFGASLAAERGCDEVYHGCCKEDFDAYRDCRPEFFKWLEMTIQAGLKTPVVGSDEIEKDYDSTGQLPREKLDIKVVTPFIREMKAETLKRVLTHFPATVLADTWTCYNGGLGKYDGKACGVCCSCQERKVSFETIGAVDPAEYYKG